MTPQAGKFRQLQFVTVRYTANIVAGEFINIGLVLFDPRGGFWGVRFRRNWQQVRVFDPDVDLETLEALGRDIEERFRRGEGEEILKTMADSFSNAVQLSAGSAILVDDPAEEIEKLASQLLGEGMPI